MREAEAKQRRGLYAKIAIARKQLPDMDEEAYRARLRTEFGKESAADLSVADLSRLVHDFAVHDGVVYTAPAKSRNKAVKPLARPDWIEVTDSMPHAPMKRQICAIWRKLGYSMSSLDKRVQRAFDCPVFLWMQDEEKLSVLLSDLQRRERSFERKRRANRGAGA